MDDEASPAASPAPTPHPLLDHHRKLHLASDDELAQVVRERAESLYHPASTCRMAPLADGGVVDAQLTVYGVRGLRVCDASIFPWLVSGHPVSSLFLFLSFC